jgi:DNA-binding MarR family transcriptional regulator
MRNGVGIKIKKVQSLIRKSVHDSETFKSNEDLTNVIGWTIGLISRRNNEGIETYQKDIEREFKISRSTATGLLQNMEKLGYLYREVSETDSRLKRIILTEKSIELNKKVLNTFDQIEQQLLIGFSIEEKKQLLEYLERLENNLERGLES